MTTYIKGTDNSAAAPAVTGTDGDTGLFFPAANTAAISTGGNERLRIDSSGNLGIGTSSPSGKLHVAGTVIIDNANATNELTFSGTEFTNVLSASTSGFQLGTTAAGYLAFLTDNTERARIDSSGNLLWAKTTTSSSSGIGIVFKKTDASSTTATVSCVGASTFSAQSTYEVFSTGAGTYRFYVDYSGSVNATYTSISAISDVRLKENIRDLDVGLSAVMQLRPRLFDWKKGKGADTKNARGFIAQEFEKVFPDLIGEWKDPAPEGEEPYKSVRQDLIPVLVKSIQELKAELDSVKAELAVIKGA